MKSLLLFIPLLILFSFAPTNPTGYILLFENSNNAKIYKFGNSGFMEYYLDKKKNILGKEYYVQVRAYSWGTSDTTYYRKDNEYFYQYKSEFNVESISIPVEPKLGFKWFEGDDSWHHEIIDIDAVYKTPARKYKHCIVMKSKQLTGRDKNKNKEYYMYYSKEFGFLGHADAAGNPQSYLLKIKTKVREGDHIGW